MNTIMLASIIAGVILLLFIITAGTYYKLFSNNYTNILCGSYLFKDDFNSYMSNTKLPLSKTGNKYTYTLWINIQNIPENSQWYENVNYNKPILYRFGSPNIYYNPMDHNLIVQVAYKDKLDMINYYDINLTELPNQKWTFIGVVVDNLYVDVYVDNKRFTSAKLPHVPYIFNRNVYLGEKQNNFNGYIANVRYYNDALKEESMVDVFNSSNSKLPNIKY